MKRANDLLLGLEVGLVFALVLVVVRAGGALGRVNQHAELAHYTPPARPAWTPTALIRLLEPLGDPHLHSPDDIAPTPAVPPGVHLLVTPMPVLPIVPPTGAPPPAGADHATGIVIPALGVDAPVLHGVEAEALKRGVGHTTQARLTRVRSATSCWRATTTSTARCSGTWPTSRRGMRSRCIRPRRVIATSCAAGAS